MTVCKYYQAGRCRFGNNCKFEHIDPPAQQQRHDPFNNNNNSTSRGHSATQPSHGNSRHESRPIWPLSAVALEDNPEQGNILEVDVSQEELRLMAYKSAPRGRSQDVSHKEAAMVAEHRSKMQAVGLPTPSSSSAPTPPNDPFANATPQPAPPAFSSFPPQNGSAPSSFPNMQPQQPQPFSTPNTFPQPQGFPSQSQTFPQSTMQPQQQPQPQPQSQQQSMHPFSSAPQMPMSQHQITATQQMPQPQMTAHPPPPQPIPSLPSQPPAQPPAQPPVLSNQAEQQFNAAQFGFAKVPESAPPPQFY